LNEIFFLNTHPLSQIRRTHANGIRSSILINYGKGMLIYDNSNKLFSNFYCRDKAPMWNGFSQEFLMDAAKKENVSHLSLITI